MSCPRSSWRCRRASAANGNDTCPITGIACAGIGKYCPVISDSSCYSDRLRIMITQASLISLRNLDLAWSRILTAKNHQHKRMFRHLYSAYEPGRRANLLLLHEKLKGGWKATHPIRVFMPKKSGLLRPLTLLPLDDQIVFQAIANQIAKQMFDRRREVEGRVVFSNCLNPDAESIFFLQDWQSTYRQFKIRARTTLDCRQPMDSPFRSRRLLRDHFAPRTPEDRRAGRRRE